MHSTRPVPLDSAAAADKYDDARLHLSNLLASGEADVAEIEEAEEAVARYSKAVYDSRRSWRRDAARFDAEAE